MSNLPSIQEKSTKVQLSVYKFMDTFCGYKIVDNETKKEMTKAQLFWKIYRTVWFEQSLGDMDRLPEYIESHIDYAMLSNQVTRIFNNLDSHYVITEKPEYAAKRLAGVSNKSRN